MTIPVTIIGGFLGAGKTTAVNHILRHARQRIAVLVNDFGALNIDAQLLAGQDGAIFALANGCVCCSIGPDFSATLAKILSLVPPPDRIVVEASGVSDPWRIAQLVKLQTGVQLEAVVVLADAETLPDLFADRWLSDTISRQMARADLVALTKCDVANEAARTAARATLTAIRPDAPVVEIAQGALPNIVIGHSSDAPPSRLVADVPDHGFKAWHWQPNASLDETRLQAVLNALPTAVLRGKGILCVGPKATQVVLQLVGRRWTLEPNPGARIRSELVLIGTEALPVPEELEARFQSTLSARTSFAAR
jgi:G3E family GTPase